MVKDKNELVRMYSLWFHLLSIEGGKKYGWWKEKGSSKEFYETDRKGYKALGIGLEDIHIIEEAKEKFNQIETLVMEIEDKGIHLLSIEEEEYPILLKEIEDPPFIIFWKGHHFLNRPALAIVGARKCSEYGYQVAMELGYDLAKAGFGVVSGMARGIDEASHKGALKIGETYAVLGNSVDICYPKQNLSLYNHIQEKGCILSEFLPPTEPRPYQFPRRNRLISGMCLGTVVVEAASRSGSLITAHLALAQNREVFAVPGNLNSALSAGSHKLIQSGAKLITKVEDILEELMPQLHFYSSNFANNCTNIPTQILDKVEIMVYDNLSWQPTELIRIAHQMNMTEINVEKILLQLEIKGFIMRLPGRRYVRLN